MKLFQKKGVAILVMVLAIALASVWGLSHRPVVVTPEGGRSAGYLPVHSLLPGVHRG